MTPQVDSYRFISGFSKRMLMNWVKMESPRPIPWTQPGKPLAECRVALLSSGGIAMRDDRPFDQQGERDNPWWGDPSYRTIPSSATQADLALYHLHVDPVPFQQDMNCLLPIQRLNQLAEDGTIGQAAARHYSIMGYNLQPHELRRRPRKLRESCKKTKLTRWC
ncbi:MAG: glycine/sarcosine/betaine reductase selenoprotein B family protein [Anaerolineales bacterium]